MCNGIKDINNCNIEERKNVLLKHLDEMLYKILVKEYQIMVFLKWKKIILNYHILFLRILKNHQQVRFFYYVV